MAEIRHCKTCGCELSEDTKGKYCLNCKSKRKGKVKKVAGAIGSATLACVLIVPRIIHKK